MRIRPAETRDAAALAELFIEMERHYGAAGTAPAAEIAAGIVAWLERQPDAVMLVAETDEGAIAGHLSAAPVFPSGSGQASLFVKDIFVREDARGQGTGADLLRACALAARRAGVARLDLTVDRKNEAASGLYARLGAVDTGKNFMRWEGSGFAALAGETGQ